LQVLRGFLPANKATERDFIMQIQQQISRWKNDLLSKFPVGKMIYYPLKQF